MMGVEWEYIKIKMGMYMGNKTKNKNGNTCDK